MEPKVLYDFSIESPANRITFLIVLLGLAVLMILILSFRDKTEKADPKSSFVQLLLLGFLTMLILTFAAGTYEYFSLKNIYANKLYHIAQGKVKHFRIVNIHPGYEAFDVNNVGFELDGMDHGLDYGYHQRNVVSENMPLTIYYVGPKNKTILHIEINPSAPHYRTDSL